MDATNFIKVETESERASCFLTDIWRPEDYKSQTRRVYSEYTCTNRRQVCNYVNDFIHHRAYLSSKLSADQIHCIHENNAKHATHKNAPNNKTQYSSRAGDAHRHIKYNKWSPCVLITDYLLDKFHITPGTRDKRLKDFYMQSRILFHYLSYQLGNERIVKARRKILKKKMSFIICSRSDQVRLIVRGSRSEGLNMQGSDTDILLEIESAYENGDVLKNGIYLTYDSMCGSLGYVTVKYVWGATLSSDKWKKMYKELLSLARYAKSTMIHGPSLSVTHFGDDFDLVPCIKCVDWPYIAQEWVYRTRKYGWPSQEMINCIVRQGCHIVPVGNNRIHVDEVEWRLSFSSAEEELVLSFNHTQLLIYGLLKIILKEKLNQDTKTADVLCSYFLKTVMFWVIEETNLDIWSPENTILCFHLCLERLIQLIIDENCPNYFVPVNNMFEKRFTSCDSKELILHALLDISANGIMWKSPSMFELEGYLDNPYRINELKATCIQKYAQEMCEMVLDLARFGKCLPFISTIQSFPRESAVRYLNSLCSNSIIRDNVANQICQFLDFSKSNAGNKRKHIFHQIFLRLLIKGCKEDLISGKAILATWLFNQRKYGDCIRVINHSLDCLKFRIVHVGPKSIHYLRPNTSCLDLRYQSMLQMLDNWKQFTTFFVPMSANSTIMPEEMSSLFSFPANPAIKCFSLVNPTMFTFPPETYCQFLKCMVYLRQGNMPTFKEECAKMERVREIASVDENVTIRLGNFLLRIILELTRQQSANNYSSDIAPYSNTSDDSLSIPPELGTQLMPIIDMISENWERIGISKDMLFKCLSTLPLHELGINPFEIIRAINQ